MTTVVEQTFWELLKAGLWEKQPAIDAKLSNEQWAEIMNHAKRQTLIGVLFDGMLCLPLELRPDEEMRMKWFWMVSMIEKSHHKLNRVLVEFTEKLQEKGIPTLLLKGQSFAVVYPKPLHRQCGDIDLFIGRKNYKKACQWVKGQNLIGHKHEADFHHQQLSFHGVVIELHRVAGEFASPFKHKRFASWSEQMLEHSTNTFIPSTEDKIIQIPELEYNVIYVFYHLLYHFFLGGIGLRQFCDWARLLHVYHDKINLDELMQNLKKYGLMEAWQVFGYLLVHQMGLPQKEFPFYKDTHRKSMKVLEDVLEQGNFGQYAKKQRPDASNYVVRRWKRFVFRSNRYIKNMRLFPSLGLGAYVLYLYERGIHFFTDFFTKK